MSVAVFPIDQALRDMAWLLNAPPLVNPNYPRFAGRVVQFSEPQRQANQRWLDQLIAQPQTLIDWLAQKPLQQLLRLGRYAEYLLSFYLQHGPCFSFVASNLPIRFASDAIVQDRTTVGEIDFLLTEVPSTDEALRANQVPRSLHWELAVKYFLCLDVPHPGTNHFVGPEAIEVFEYKLQKLFERQLVNKPPPPFNDRNWLPAAFTRGWIFYPMNRPNIVVDWLSPEHLRGVWLSITQFETQFEHCAGDCFEILNRQRWLSPASGHASSVLTRAQLIQAIRAMWLQPNAFQRWPSAVLVAKIDPTSQQETGRLFIVPDNWIGFELSLGSN